MMAPGIRELIENNIWSLLVVYAVCITLSKSKKFTQLPPMMILIDMNHLFGQIWVQASSANFLIDNRGEETLEEGQLYIQRS